MDRDPRIEKAKKERQATLAAKEASEAQVKAQTLEAALQLEAQVVKYLIDKVKACIKRFLDGYKDGCDSYSDTLSFDIFKACDFQGLFAGITLVSNVEKYGKDLSRLISDLIEAAKVRCIKKARRAGYIVKIDFDQHFANVVINIKLDE